MSKKKSICLHFSIGQFFINSNSTYEFKSSGGFNDLNPKLQSIKNDYYDPERKRYHSRDNSIFNPTQHQKSKIESLYKD